MAQHILDTIPDACSPFAVPKRVLIACINCRRQKVKCLSTSEDTPCMGCQLKGLTCEYRRIQHARQRRVTQPRRASHTVGDEPGVGGRRRTSVNAAADAFPRGMLRVSPPTGLPLPRATSVGGASGSGSTPSSAGPSPRFQTLNVDSAASATGDFPAGPDPVSVLYIDGSAPYQRQHCHRRATSGYYTYGDHADLDLDSPSNSNASTPTLAAAVARSHRSNSSWDEYDYMGLPSLESVAGAGAPLPAPGATPGSTSQMQPRAAAAEWRMPQPIPEEYDISALADDGSAGISVLARQKDYVSADGERWGYNAYNAVSVY
ncbi:Zn(2)-C6 fungal-type domain-containing protein [Mycena kentingensis (nom. inval.)]|nr:Zn(2)-C6 fungal-type domain-containing protein [Mycena kentingensis (nom. inval.)]